MRETHLQRLHAGTQLTLYSVRQKYWILNSQSGKNHDHDQLMGNLPAARVTPARPFLHTGVDYAGPIWIRTSKGRGHHAHKGYLAIFVCFTTKAIHLEVVSDYTAETFVAAFRRFVARRGLPSDMYSDNGTTFVVTNKEIQIAIKDAQRFALPSSTSKNTSVGITSSHFGGLWEAGVKSMKFHLIRLTDDRKITFEEWNTFLCQIESNVNSRPLTALHDSPDDLLPLTARHFLIGQPLSAKPEQSLLDVNSNRLSPWQLIQQLNESFWIHWRQQYLYALQTRQKWRIEKEGLESREIALIRNLATPPSKWPLARVTELFPS
ncbi:uncharacterized protein LOC107042044 [Diachasma alloeum]|uniref:uncharacterized protein LOC107042044 n=1 Tax=Diachasma alloeum TaxID=454923 RepID=UPI0007381A97|nr:uncharacterized protein LOC107042044 [Diachasma alloeum]